MRTERFNSIIEAATDRSLNMLARKNDAYSGNADYDVESQAKDDRLRGIKTIASISGVTPWAALRGVMAKHTMSVYDLISDADLGEVADLGIWQEKISDHINYLLMLEALVFEHQDEMDERMSESRPNDFVEVDLDMSMYNKNQEGQPDNLNAVNIYKQTEQILRDAGAK